MPWGKDKPFAALTKARSCYDQSPLLLRPKPFAALTKAHCRLYKRKVVCQKRFRDISLKVF